MLFNFAKAQKTLQKNKYKYLSVLILLLIVLVIWGVKNNQIKTNTDIDEKIQNSILDQEMQPKLVSKNESNQETWHMVNSLQGLRSYFSQNGWITQAKNQNTDGNWQINYQFQGLSRTGNKIIPAQFESISANIEQKTVTLLYNNGIKIWYQNTPNGIKQNFSLENKISGSGSLQIMAKINDDLSAQIIRNSLLFFNANKKLLHFSSLHIVDANGEELSGKYEFDSTSHTLSYIIDDTNAVYPITIDPLASNPVWIGLGDQTNEYFAKSASTAGDVNGDGYDDVIIGAYMYDTGVADAGKVFVYYGSANGLSASTDWTVEADQENAQFGWVVANAGDVNNDNYDDVIIGSLLYDNGEVDEGKAFVYYGSASGLSASPDWTYESNQANAKLGNSVATAGDVNGDGYDDIVVGSVHYDNGEDNEGKAFVYYGSDSGLSVSPDWTYESNQVNAQFGIAVSTAGDTNADGYDDVLIGANFYTNGQTKEGSAFIFNGSIDGLSSSPDWQVESNQANSQFANYLSTAGDVNNDGYGDIMIGAHVYDNGEVDEGTVFVYYGSDNGPSTSPDWTAEGNQTSADFGIGVSMAGDVNCDGYDDIIIGANLYNTEIVDAGKVFVYYGSASGLLTSPSWTISGEQASIYFGRAVATAGDTNADSCSDIIIGANLYDNGKGEAYVYLGGGLPNININAISGPTTENGGTASFTVVLNSEPTSNVSLNIHSSDNTEGVTSASSLTFTNNNWFIPQTVTVTGVNDSIADGNQSYTIILDSAVSDDSNYNNLNPDDVTVINNDDDVANITVSAISSHTTENNGTASFTVVLTSQSTADVNISIASSDTTEGTVSPASLTFTEANWSTPQTITVTGVNDSIADGNQSYTIILDSAVSDDSNYNNLNPDDVTVINNDDDNAGITVSAILDHTTESGDTATFTIILTSQATADVNITIASSDTTEGTVSPMSLTFTSANWSIPQTVTVTGADDLVTDGHQTYSIILSNAVSNDSNYDNLNPGDVTVINYDDDATNGSKSTDLNNLINTKEQKIQNNNDNSSDNLDLTTNNESTQNTNVSINNSETQLKLDYYQSWAKDYIQKLYDLKLASGCDNKNNFCPDQYISRAEAIKIILNSSHIDIDTYLPEENIFTDLDPSHWAYNIILTAYHHEIINGYNDNTVRPDGFITRGQAMKIIFEANQMTFVENVSNIFKDVNNKAWYAKYILSAFAKNIVQGYTTEDGVYFKPETFITRAEFAKITILSMEIENQ